MATGLVQCAITDETPQTQAQTGYARLDVHAGHVTIKMITKGPPSPQGAPQRGKVRGMSRKSRKRLLERISATRGLKGAFFVTLTYPDEFPEDPRQQYRDLKVLLQRILHEHPDAGYIWRKEYKKRRSGVNVGLIAPHFHLFLLMPGQLLTNVRSYISRAWFEVVGSGDERHERAGTQVDTLKNLRHAMYYASKYIAKQDDDALPDGTGRIWGYGGSLDAQASVTVTLTRAQYVEMKRLTAAWLRSKRNRYGRFIKRMPAGFSFTVFGLGDETGPPGMEGINSAILSFILAALEK